MEEKELRDKIADLEAKLAEKEKEIEELICDYESRITKEQELMSWLEHKVEENDQAKTDFAIEKLEKVKEFCNNPLVQNVYGNIPEFRVENFIDNQIKELKEKK